MLPGVYLVHEEGLRLTFDSNMMELWSSCKGLKTNRGCTAHTAGLFTVLKCVFIVRSAALLLIFTWEKEGCAAQPAVTNEHQQCPGIGKQHSTIPTCHRHLKRLKLLPPVCSCSPLYMWFLLLWYQKKVGNYQRPVPESPPPSPPTSPRGTCRTFGHWTLNSFLVCELDECKHEWREGAKTKVLLRGIHCVNILAGGGAVATIYRQRERCTRGYLMRGSPLRAPG